ncbi:hypothetical protein [Acetobacterium wieringae]|uniref:hypothetical protein n=1 Tax=Acetobacterium wieringae TaxID=52694 RepID=UPI0031585FBC
MNTNYDRELMEIEFYDRFHPEFMPYVGDNYEKAKILLCCEEPFVDGNKLSADVVRLIESPDWYTTVSSVRDKLPYEDCIEFCQNRVIINDMMMTKENGKKTDVAHNLYLNPAKIFREVFPQIENPWDAFSYFAWMNYFQKPATKFVKNLIPVPHDCQFAVDNLCRVVNVLKPKLIIFLSKTSFQALKTNMPDDLRDMTIRACAHPTGPWWSRDYGRVGREAFRNIIKEHATIELI